MLKSMVYYFSAYSAGCTICCITQHIVQNTVLYSLNQAIQYCSAYCARCNTGQQCGMQQNSVYSMGCSTIQHTVWVRILFSIQRRMQYYSTYSVGGNIVQYLAWEVILLNIYCGKQYCSVFSVGCSTTQHTMWYAILFSIQCWIAVLLSMQHVDHLVEIFFVVILQCSASLQHLMKNYLLYDLEDSFT